MIMLISGIPVDSFISTVGRISRERYAGNVILVPNVPVALNTTGTRYRCRIRTIASDGPGARRSWSGRRGPFACWHAYRDVIRAALTAYPEARIRTGMASYRGLAGFERDYPATGGRNIGSMALPVTMPELCACTDTDHAGPAPVDWPAQPRLTPSHVDYPHSPGQLFDCPACEARCHCTGDPGHTECVYCAERDSVESSDILVRIDRAIDRATYTDSTGEIFYATQ